jgi:adenylylsulfate kinase
MKILVMGLSGTGKSTFAEKLYHEIVKNNLTEWINADDVRSETKDWDFSDEGRLRQAKRMTVLANRLVEDEYIVVADFICPKQEYRQLFDADVTVWMDTADTSDYADTDKIFEKPTDDEYTFRVAAKDDIDKTVAVVADLVEILVDNDSK